MGNLLKSAKVDQGLRYLCQQRQPGQIFTRSEIAKACSCSPQAIDAIEQRALTKLRERLRRELGYTKAQWSEMSAELL